MARRRHLKAEVGVSAAAKALIEAAFADGRPSYEAIAKQVLDATGETIGKSSVQRYWCEWNARRQAGEARDQAHALIAEFKDRPAGEVEQALEALATATIYRGMASREGEELSAAQALVAQDRLARRKLKDRELTIEGKRVDLLERKLAAMEAKIKQAAGDLDQLAKKKQLDPEDLRTIREQLYGIAGAPEN